MPEHSLQILLPVKFWNCVHKQNYSRCAVLFFFFGEIIFPDKFLSPSCAHFLRYTTGFS